VLPHRRVRYHHQNIVAANEYQDAFGHIAQSSQAATPSTTRRIQQKTFMTSESLFSIHPPLTARKFKLARNTRTVIQAQTHSNSREAQVISEVESLRWLTQLLGWVSDTPLGELVKFASGFLLSLLFSMSFSLRPRLRHVSPCSATFVQSTAWTTNTCYLIRQLAGNCRFSAVLF